MMGLKVYAAIASVAAGLSEGIAKNRYNRDHDYWYRGIDDVTAALSPLLAKHRLCLFPTVRKQKIAEMSDGGTKATVRLELEFISARDGSRHSVEIVGEAVDSTDKAAAKAISAAYKQALLLTFCVPCAYEDECQPTCEKKVTSTEKDLEDPDQGWEQWTDDIQSLISQCETTEAIDRVRNTYADQLRACSRRSSEHFAQIGTTMQEKRRSLQSRRADRTAAVADLAKLEHGRKDCDGGTIPSPHPTPTSH